MKIKNLTLISLLLVLTHHNIVISVDTTALYVSQSATISVKIRTSTSISLLKIQISDDFTIDSNPSCQIDSVSTACETQPALSGSKTVIKFTSFSFSPSINYNISIPLINAPYAENFQIDAYNDITVFSSFGILTVETLPITCSMESNSTIVGRSSSVTFSIGIQTLNIGQTGELHIKTASQTVFPNIFNSNPICIIEDNEYACTLSQVFGEQIISILNAPVGKKADSSPLQLTIKTLNNPPYNATFENITIRVEDSQSRDVESCIFEQKKPETLQASTTLEFQNWQSLVGKTSDTQILLTPYFSPLSDLIVLLVYPSELTITPKAPITSTSEVIEGNTHLTAQNITLVDGVLNLQCQVINPSSAIPLSLNTYILYNSTHFREEKELLQSFLTLTAQSINTISSSVGIAQTLTGTTLNLTFESPITISQSTSIILTIQYGSVDCDNLNLQSNITTLTETTCSANQLTLSTSTPSAMISSRSYWIQFGYITHVSTQTNNIEMVVESVSGYDIMRGSTEVTVSEGVSSFTITNANTVYTQMTNFTISEQNLTQISTSIIRIVNIQLPSYVLLSSTTSVAASNSQSTILATEIDQGSNKVIVRIGGRVDIILVDIENPSHYEGSRVWSLTLTDISQNPSSSASATHTPQYSPTTAVLSITSHSEKTIQQNNNMTLSIEPQLQYSLGDPPTIIVQFSASSIKSLENSLCPGCTLLTSTKFSFEYYAVFMEVTVQVQNNGNPDDNQIELTISLNSFTYETSLIQYTLEPIAYDYIVTFTGFYGEEGQLTINLTTQLSQDVNVTYSGTQAIFSSGQQCLNCNSTFLTITGIVNFFTTAKVVVEGRSDGVLYASGIVDVSYTCSSITGCQICQNLNTTGTLGCTKCFAQQFTNFYLLYNSKCYSTCPSSTYADGVLCTSCQALCYVCTASECLQCQTPYSLYLESCVLECPPSYIKNATHCLPRPIICPQDCIDCPADNECNRCDSGFYLLQNLCYSKCPSGYVIADNNYECEEFIPPEETDYFPFAFLIASVLTFAILGITKCFEKRSLVLGNFIAIISLFEIGVIIMMLSYTFDSILNDPDRWTSDMILASQAQLFVILVTKVALNLIFLAYFLVNIASEQNFQEWKQKSQNNNCLYKTMLILSAIFSFQIIRIIYSRLLGLELFFGRFKTALIFKPVNYFSLAYIIPATCLIVMSVNNIILQDGYKTSIFYSSIQVIIIQVFILVACLIQSRRADHEYFDYQVYKVDNLHEETSGSKINITYQKQSGGSMHQVLSTGYKVKGVEIIEEEEEMGGNAQAWRRKTYQPSISDDDEINENERNKNSKRKKKKLNYSNEQKKSPSIFRQKILNEWENLRSKMPNTGLQFYRQPSHQRVSISPSHPRKTRKLMKTGSLEKMEVKSPHFDFKDKGLLKKYFYQINQKEDEEDSYQNDGKELDEVPGLNSDINTDHDYEVIGKKQSGDKGDVSEIKNAASEESFQKSLLEIGSNIKVNRYADFEKEEEDQANNHNIRNRRGDNERMVGQYGGMQSHNLKKYRNKKRIVNKQTEAVYLQRLASSEAQRKNTGYQRKLDDF